MTCRLLYFDLVHVEAPEGSCPLSRQHVFKVWSESNKNWTFVWGVSMVNTLGNEASVAQLSLDLALIDYIDLKLLAYCSNPYNHNQTLKGPRPW